MKFAPFFRRAFGILAVAGFTLWFGFSLIAFYVTTHPPRTPIGVLSPEQYGCRGEEIRFPSRDGTPLFGWILRPDDTGTRNAGPEGYQTAFACAERETVPRAGDSVSRLPIVVVHGLNSSMEDALPFGAFLACAGHPVLVFDLRASGRSGGSASSLGLFEAEDVSAAAAILSRRTGSGRVGVLGSSLGAAAAARAAESDSRISILVLDAPFENLPAVIRHRAHLHFGLLGDAAAPLFPPFYRLLFGRWPSEVSPTRALAARPVPLLVLSGTDDILIPPEQHRRVYEASMGPKKFLSFEGSWHCGAHAMEGSRYEREVLSFLEGNGR